MKNFRGFQISLFILYFSTIVYSQPNEYWTKYYDGGSLDYARRMVKDNSGNYIVTGSSVVSYPGFSNYQVLTIKYDSLGNQKWVRGEDNPINSMDDPTGLIVDDSDNVYVAGIFGNYSCLLKYDKSGNKKWSRAFYSYYVDITTVDRQLCLDTEGNIYCAVPVITNGHRHSSVRKYSSNGDLIWYTYFDELSRTEDYPASIISDNSSFMYLTGYTEVTDTNTNYYVVKFDKNGSIIWQNNFGTDSSSINTPIKIIFGSDSTLYLLGTRRTHDFDTDINIMKLDTSGNEIWEKNINRTSDWLSYPADIKVDSDHNIYVTNSIEKFVPPNRDHNLFYISKYDNNGNFIWDNLSVDTLVFNGGGYDLQLDDKNNLYVTAASTEFGIIAYDMMVLKFDSSENLVWSLSKNFYGGSNRPVETILNSEDDFTIFLTCGYIGSDYVTTRYSNNISSVNNDQWVYQYDLMQNYPNPFNPTTKIRYSISDAESRLNKFVQIKIYDILGNEVATLVNKEQPAGEYEINFNGRNLSSGVYFYSLEVGDYKSVKKMILLK